MACADLVQLDLPETKILSATEIPAGPFPFGNPAPTCASPIAAPQLPAHCRVVGTIAPSITFEVWLPPAESWNGKFQAFGNHGFAGSIDYSDLGPELVKGYAIASTDAGHAGDDTAWMRNEQQVIDYGHRGVHEMTVKSKAVVKAFYGKAAKYSYFNGCSTGGKEGLMEAQRYPDDYDGIVVGHPNFDQIGNRAQYVWNGQATFGASPATPIAGAKLALINNAATSTCDALDGVVDGVIDDPRSCPFQPASLLCQAGQDPATCLTSNEVAALEKVYAGPKNPRTGEQVYPGLVKGSERGWGGHTAGPNIFATADQFFKFMVFNDPAWDYRGFDFDADLAFAMENFAHLINATDPNLKAFQRRGGKILHYHSYRSTTHTAPKSIEYYEQVVATMNHRRNGELRPKDFARTQDFYRLFMAPGGSGNKGPEKFDPLPYLERWVEQGVAPERIIAANIAAGVIDRTRPLCPHPQVAVYKGSGSVDAAENFSCSEKAD
jgi:feruloyl esterase